MKKSVRVYTSVFYTLISTIFLAIGSMLSADHRSLYAILLFISGVVAYLIVTLKLTNRNWLDLRGVFSFVWLITLALANLRLLRYQKVWQNSTWHLLAVAYLVFQVGFHVGILTFREQRNLVDRLGRYDRRRFQWQFRKERLFSVCVTATLIGIASLVANILARGFIPIFSSNQHAYVEFYTKFQVIAVAATTASGLCYYCLRTADLSVWRKTVLFFCIIYLAFVYHILVLSRGTFMVSAISLTTVVFYLSRRRFLALVSCLTIIAVVFAGLSGARNYSETQLISFFEPVEVTFFEEPLADPAELSSSDEIDEPRTETYKLSPKLASLYAYLTVSHDNFNEGVKHAKQLSYGVRQFRPFNVILRIPMPAIEEAYTIRPHLTTHNLISDAYYDFRGIGVAASVFVWSFVFGALQVWYENTRSPFILLMLSYAVSSVALSFFTPWMSNFTHWMHWGTVLLFYLFTRVAKSGHMLKQF